MLSYLIYCICVTDRPGLRGADLVEKLQMSITRGLQLQMKVNHHDDQSIFAKLLVKVSELRMLNTVHSEKLLGEHPRSSSAPSCAYECVNVRIQGGCVYCFRDYAVGKPRLINCAFINLLHHTSSNLPKILVLML